VSCAGAGDLLKVPAWLAGQASRRFMWITDILPLPSRAAAGLCTAADVMATRDISTPYFERILRQMQQDGVNRWPIWVAPAVTMNWTTPWADPALTQSGRLAFGGGHHRLRMAVELGWTRLLTTDHIGDHYQGITSLRLACGYSPEPGKGPR
jgi:hypothetical protein